MKATDSFKATIQAYLDEREKTDELFARRRQAVNRSLDDIVTYILNQVKTSGCNGFADDEIYSMAVHAAEEETIEVGTPIDVNVVVNHVEEVMLTEEEKKQARIAALKKLEAETYQQLKKRQQTTQKKKPAQQEDLGPSLF